MARRSSNILTHTAILLLTITACSEQQEYTQDIPTWQSLSDDGAVTISSTTMESADATTSTTTFVGMQDGRAQVFFSTTTVEGYTSTRTQIAISHPAAPWRTSTQDPAASSASVASLGAKDVSLSSQLGPWTILPISMPSEPLARRIQDNCITVLEENGGITTWGAVRSSFIWDSAVETANISAYNEPQHTFTSNANTLINTYTQTQTNQWGNETSETARTWYCSHTTIAAANPIPKEVSATMKYADYTAWGDDKDISRSAVCTQSAVTVKVGQTTMTEFAEKLSWVETQKFYVTVLGEAALTIGKEAAVTGTSSGTASGSQTTAGQAGSGATSGAATGNGQPPNTSTQAAGAAEVTMFVSAVALVAAAAALVI